MDNNNAKKKNAKSGPGGSMNRIEYLPTSSLVPYARNSRTHSDTQIDQIAASIKEFGFCNPVLIDADGGIIAGHGRVLAATQLDIESVPCIRLSHLTEMQRRAYVIADNQIALNSEWDESLLSIELQELGELDFDSSVLGFDDSELLDLSGVSIECVVGIEGEIPPLPEKAVTQRGDLWLLGDSHRLYCGDSSDPRDIRRAQGGWDFDVAVVDPPYEAGNAAWLKWIMDPCVVFGQVKHLRMIPDSLWRFERVIVKNYRNRSATIQVGHMHAMVAQCGTKKVLPKDKKATFPSVLQQEVDTEHDHQKPVGLIVEHLTHWTPSWNCVVDPYGGSGSTALASESMGRRSITIELNPAWCDFIAERFAKATGKLTQRVAKEEVESYNNAAAGAETPGQHRNPKTVKESSNV